jgi:hypothetical protein
VFDVSTSIRSAFLRRKMERAYGSAEEWQASATREWLVRLADLPSDVTLAVLDGQTRPSFPFEGATRVAPHAVHCRASGLFFGGTEHKAAHFAQATGARRCEMDHWAAYLRGRADALNLTVIDTTSMTVAQAADEFGQPLAPDLRPCSGTASFRKWACRPTFLSRQDRKADPMKGAPT